MMSVRERGGGRGEGAGLRQAGAGWVSWAERGLCRAGKEKEVGEEKESWVGPRENGKERRTKVFSFFTKQKVHIFFLTKQQDLFEIKTFQI